MAKSPTLHFLLLFLLLSILSATTTAATTNTSTDTATATASSTAFIVEKCSKTKYATLCVQSLSAYATKIQRSQQLLVQTALSVSLQHAQLTKSFIRRLRANFKSLRPREAAALKDCAEQLEDTVDRLSDAEQELQRAGRCRGRYEEFRWHMSNVQTWVSAALTDDATCLDGFVGSAMNGKVKSSVRDQVDDVVHCTSNALALINQYAAMR